MAIGFFSKIVRGSLLTLIRNEMNKIRLRHGNLVCNISRLLKDKEKLCKLRQVSQPRSLSDFGSALSTTAKTACPRSLPPGTKPLSCSAQPSCLGSPEAAKLAQAKLAAFWN